MAPGPNVNVFEPMTTRELPSSLNVIEPAVRVCVAEGKGFHENEPSLRPSGPAETSWLAMVAKTGVALGPIVNVVPEMMARVLPISVMETPPTMPIWELLGFRAVPPIVEPWKMMPDGPIVMGSPLKMVVV